MAARLVPLGGLGEFGANALLVEHGEDGRAERLVIDAGAAFSGLEAYGVAYEVPDFGMLEGLPPVALVLTHGHDDHVRGVGLFAHAFPRCPIHGTRATLMRAARTFGGEAPPAHVLHAERRLTVGSVVVDALPVSHSIPGTVMLRLRNEAFTLVLATDFRLAVSALGEGTAREVLDAWGRDGVDLLLLDATNALVREEPPSEREVGDALAELVRTARGAVVATTFASHLGRFRQLAEAAQRVGRKVVPVGQGLVESLETQVALGAFDLPPGLTVQARDLVRHARNDLVIVATGAQGEPLAGFPQIAADQLPGFRLTPGDVVIHAARIIPGNERRLAGLFDDCVRRGARVVTAAEAPTHASGHAHRRELEELLDALRPASVLPVHGRRRHLQAVAELAARAGAKAIVVENGQEVEVSDAGVRATGRLRGVGRVLFGDGDGAPLDPALVKWRRSLAREGLVLALLPLGEGAGATLRDPLIHATGIELPPALCESLGTRLGDVLRHERSARRLDPDALRSTMTRWLRAELRRATRRRPVVSALVLER
jgi:ribonuclease J